MNPFTLSRPGDAPYAGVMTFGRAPLALTPEQLGGADVAILGAPCDEGVLNRPGARFGPRAIREADYLPPERPHMLLGVDALSELSVVDYGDAECMPTDLAFSHREIERRVGEVLEVGAIPVVLGGDHSIAHPTMTAVARHFGKKNVGVIHFDTHTDTADEALFGVAMSHGTPMRRVITDGSIDGAHFIQVGIRGFWPGAEVFDWMRSAGMRWHTIYEVMERGISEVIDDVVAAARDFPEHIYLTVDVDVLDPAFAPGTGTPEPGGLTSRELLYAVRNIAQELPIVGMEVVEVSPPYDPTGITALVANRCVCEALSGIALRRSGRTAAPELPEVVA